MWHILKMRHTEVEAQFENAHTEKAAQLENAAH